MKKIYMLALTFMVLFSMTMGVEALQQKTINRQNGESAYADWTKTTGDLTTETLLSVTQSNIGTDISMSICTYDYITGNGSCKSGYMFTQDNVFSMDKKLDSASLKAVTIELSEWTCDNTGMCLQTPAGTATIDATWTATGKVSTSSYKWQSKDGNYIAKGSSSSSSRLATAQGTLNNDKLGTSSFGGMAKFKSVGITMTK
jgi:hypothetical protein